MGKNDVKRAEPITAPQLKAYCDHLSKLLDEMRDAHITALRQENETLYTYNLASLDNGMKRLRAFVQALADSNFRAKTNNPIQQNELKNVRRAEDDPPKKAGRKR